MISLLIILAVTFTVKSFLHHPHFSDVPESGIYVGEEVAETKYITKRPSAICQLYQEESGIPVEEIKA